MSCIIFVKFKEVYIRYKVFSLKKRMSWINNSGAVPVLKAIVTVVKALNNLLQFVNSLSLLFTPSRGIPGGNKGTELDR